MSNPETPEPISPSAALVQLAEPKLRRNSWTYRFGAVLTLLGGWNGVAALWPAVAAIPGVPVWLLGVGAAVIALRERTGAPLAPLVAPRTTTVPVVLLALGLALSSCAAPGGAGTSAGVVASVTVPDSETAGPRELLVRYDGNTLVAWASTSYLSEIWIQATGLPILLRQGGAGVALVRRRDPEFSWEGRVGDPLPEAARALFRPPEITNWGILFAPPAVVAPAPTAPAKP